MVELVVVLDEFVAIVGDGRGRIVLTGGANDGGEVGDALNDFLLLDRNLGGGIDGRHFEAGFLRLAENGADAGVGVLDEGAGVAVEVDGLFGVEDHVLAGVDLE